MENNITKNNILKYIKILYNEYLSIFILVFVVVLVYWPVFFNQILLQWDDCWVPINRYTEAGFSLTNIWNILFEFYNGQYAPVNEFFYLILYKISGNIYNPIVFHSACLLIHIINVLLIYHFIKKLLIQTKNFENLPAKIIAFFTALLVGIHPFLVEAVAWISASKIVLYVMFFLIGLIFYLRYVETKNIKYWCITLIFFVLSFGAKEQAVVFPIILLLIDYIYKRNIKNRNIWIEKSPFILLALFFSIITVLSQGAVDFSNVDTYPLYQRFVFACYSLTEYLTKFLIPVKLSYIYPFPSLPGESLPLRFWFYPVVVSALVFGLWHYIKKDRWIFFGAIWFVVGLLPALHIISLGRFAIIADRYSYLSGIGIFFIMAYFINVAIINKSKYLKIISFAVLLYLVVIGCYAHVRTKVWYNSDTLKKELREQLKQRNIFENNYN